MTKQQAIEFLRQWACQNHDVVFVPVGPSHGDPGGYSVIRSACAAVTHDGYSIKDTDDALCNCPAKAHNAKVEEALVILARSDST